MSFNHYAKIKRILEQQPAGWRVVRINRPTSAKTFQGETRQYPHYYRIYDVAGLPIPFCKFQQLDRFCQTMNITEYTAKDILQRDTE